MSEEISVPTKVRLPLTHSGVMKALAFVLAVVFLAAAVLGVLGVALCLDYGVYTTDEEELRANTLGYAAASYYLAWMALQDSEDGLRAYPDESSVALLKVEVHGEREATYTEGSYSGGDKYTRVFAYDKYIDRSNTGEGEGSYDVWYNGQEIPEHTENYIVVTVWMDTEPTVYDNYFWGSLIIDLAYELCWWLIAIAAGGLLGFILCLVFLCASAGRRRGKPEPQPSWATKIPFDLATAAAVGAVVFLLWLIFDWLYLSDPFTMALAALCCLGIAIIALWWLMSLALRIKTGLLVRNTLIYAVLRLLWRGAKAVGRFVRAFFRRFGLVWWAVAGVAVVAVLEFFVILATQWDAAVELLLWALKTVVILVVVVFLAYMLRDLQRMGASIASGDMTYRADTRHMPLPLKNHAEHLSSIGQGINRAVNQRMKSERMKTELITNVSHDIKTPLTSIINYADLICREDCDNPKIQEYAEVLHRQSERMKRLIEDLVEASKASTGNVEINLAPCEAGVMLMQVAAEYEARLQQQSLSLVAGQPVHELTILADGRRLWRVMDNLMNNICKYAMPGTRVYLALEDAGSHAVISFKNTSREPLNMSPDELMERFVRGDAARNSEGSGLGLSIARSLTELQGGKLEISCDGDLFKAVLKFPIVK